MALRLKKDVKKASYYVWFLGAQESRGLRGEEFALPAIRHLEQRARDLEPFKVTLQVSHKGLKIIQNVSAKGKQQTIKHFIPHGSITSAVVQGDVVACVLLLYNPLTGCPVHVHAYRCDSEHTAEMLYAHLQALIERPENQKKFAEIERKLRTRGALPSRVNKPPDSSLGSELSARESDSGSNEERCVANLYDSLAAELKQKLSTGKSPILLPPRDYDTVHRQKGNLSNIDTRRCLNRTIVGVNVNGRRNLESSGGSSGIGSDLAPSPERNEYAKQNDNHSTSEEDWAESTAYLMHEAFDPTPRRALSPRRYQPSYEEREPYREKRDRSFDRVYRQSSLEHAPKVEPFEDTQYRRRFEQNANRSIDRDDRHRRDFPKMQRGVSEGSLVAEASPKDRFNVAKEKFKNLERERFNRELEQHMAIRRSILERNARSTSSPEDEEPRREIERLPRVGRKDIKRYEYGVEDYLEQPKRDYERHEKRRDERPRRDERDFERHEPKRRDDFAEIKRRDDFEREPKRDYEAKRRDEYDRHDKPKEYDLRRDFDRYRDKRELVRCIEEDEVIEPVIEDRPRRSEWDRQRAFSRSRLLDQNQYEERFYDRERQLPGRERELQGLSERQPAKYRHSYAEPIPRGRLGTVRPY